MNKFYKYKIIIIMTIINYLFNDDKRNISKNQLIIKNECILPKIYLINEQFKYDANIKSDSILILELFPFHYECTPGYAKYFIELGYHIDIIMNKMGLTTFCFFGDINYIHLLLYEKSKDVIKNAPYFKKLFSKYQYILIETMIPNYVYVYKKLNLFNINKSIFVFHHIDFVDFLPTEIHLENYRIWSLGKFPIGIQVIRLLYNLIILIAIKKNKYQFFSLNILSLVNIKHLPKKIYQKI